MFYYSRALDRPLVHETYNRNRMRYLTQSTTERQYLPSGVRKVRKEDHNL